MNRPVLQQSEQKALVFLLSGFLGSGKTTLLKRILSWETDLSDTVVLVNEFGDVGIDGDLLKNSGSDVVELVSGCICCSLRNDLKQSLLRILNEYRPKRIFIEASGVSDPTAILSVLFEAPLAESIILEKIVTVLDADLWEARENFGQIFYNQLKTANLILLNKADLLDKASIPACLKEVHELYPHCQVVPTIRCCVDPEIFWSQKMPDKMEIKPMQSLLEASREDTAHNSLQNQLKIQEAFQSSDHFVTFSFEDSRIIDETHFNHFVDALPFEVFRMKGPVQFANRTDIVNFVGGKGEWSIWEGSPETRLAFIGWHVNPADILSKLQRCIAGQ
jgi:G3E family GTPase